MPESVTDRPTRAHEEIFLLAKSQKYYYDAAAIGEPLVAPPHKPGFRNKRSVWTVATQAFPLAHFATFPEKLIEPCILAGCSEGGIVLDPFFGSGTVGKRAKELSRRWVGIELNPEYVEMARRRVCQEELF